MNKIEYVFPHCSFTFYCSSIKGKNRRVDLAYKIENLHSTVVLLKENPKLCYVIPYFNLHSTVVLLKGISDCS